MIFLLLLGARLQREISVRLMHLYEVHLPALTAVPTPKLASPMPDEYEMTPKKAWEVSWIQREI